MAREDGVPLLLKDGSDASRVSREIASAGIAEGGGGENIQHFQPAENLTSGSVSLAVHFSSGRLGRLGAGGASDAACEGRDGAKESGEGIDTDLIEAHRFDGIVMVQVIEVVHVLLLLLQDALDGDGSRMLVRDIVSKALNPPRSTWASLSHSPS